MMSVRLINIMPMAGEGKRFRDEGYKDPKPLIKIKNKRFLDIILSKLIRYNFRNIWN